MVLIPAVRRIGEVLVIDRCLARREAESLHASGLCCSQGAESALNSRSDQFILILWHVNDEGRGYMNDVSRPLHGALQRFTIEQISLDELKLLKQVTVCLA